MIRVAEQKDIESLVEFGRLLHKESSYSNGSYVDDKVRDLMSGLIGSEYGAVFVSEIDGRVIGAFAGGITEHWFSNDLHAFDYSFYVLPDFRGGSSAYRLLLAFEMWARAKGALEIDIGITTGIQEEKTQRFYEKMGFVQTGRLFGKVLEVDHV